MHVSFEQYHQFSAPLEGRVPTMYADCLGLITTGVGNLINTQQSALALPWLLADGSKATSGEVLTDWNKLHANPSYYAARKWTVYTKTMLCHLSDEAIDALVQRQLDLNEAIIRKRFPKWDTFPADAQLAIMSMAWAVGAAFYQKFGNLAKLIDAENWELAARLDVPSDPKSNWPGKIREAGNPGVVPRNVKNRFCFQNAAVVKAAGLEVTTLHWPEAPSSPQAAPGDLVVKAQAAQAEAEAAVVNWQADPISRFVDAEYERIRNTSSARAAMDAERDTDPSDLVPESKV